MIKGIIFDLDGTLINSMHVWDHIGECVLKRWSLQTQENLNEIFKDLSLHEAAHYLQKTYVNDKSITTILEAIINEVRYRYESEVDLKPGTKELLQLLRARKTPCCIITGSDKQCAISVLQRYDILAQFSFIMTCEDVQLHKRDARIFTLASKKMNIETKQCLVVEDALFAIKGAQAAGCKTAMVYDESQKEDWMKHKAIADYNFLTLNEVENFLCTRL